MVENNVYQDLYVDQNLLTVDTSQFDVAWWYQTTFTLPPLSPTQAATILFTGINYRANVYLNGRTMIASSPYTVGTFRYFKLDITRQLNATGANTLAVEVFRPVVLKHTH